MTTVGSPEAPQASCADEINRLHAQAAERCIASAEALHAALESAWRAGRLLLEEKRRVRRTMGPGAWTLWLERYFSDTARTAQRYMLLAKKVADVQFLRGMGLRQAYLRLGIATESKSPARGEGQWRLPPHLVLANRMVCMLGKAMSSDGETAELRFAWRRDLRPLYEALQSLFDDPAALIRCDTDESFGRVAQVAPQPAVGVESETEGAKGTPEASGPAKSGRGGKRAGP